MLAFTLASLVDVAACICSMTFLTVSLLDGASSIGRRGLPRDAATLPPRDRERVTLLATLAALGSLLAAEGSREELGCRTVLAMLGCRTVVAMLDCRDAAGDGP